MMCHMLEKFLVSGKKKVIVTILCYYKKMCVVSSKTLCLKINILLCISIKSVKSYVSSY